MRRVPELVFRPDASVRSAERIEGILREIQVEGGGADDEGPSRVDDDPRDDS